MSGLKKFVTALLQIITVTVLADHGHAILNRHPCREENLKIICECDYKQQNLDIPAFNFSNLHDTATSITIQNCQHVSIGSRSIEHLRNLRHLYIRNVQDLRLQERSFYWDVYRTDILDNVPLLAITISHSKLEKIPNYAFSGKLAELRLEDTAIDTVFAFAFSSITKLRVIALKNSTFKNIQAQAFKKIETESFIISGTRLGILPSRAIADTDVSEVFQVVNSDFDIIRPSGMIINFPKSVEILNSRFNTIESDGIRLRAKGNIIIKNNTFGNLHPGAFKGISLIKEPRTSYTKEVLFANNIVNAFNYDAISFNRTSFTPKYQTLIINQTCACADIKTWWAGAGQLQEEIHCLVTDHRSIRTVKASTFHNDNCQVGSNFWLILGLVIAGLVVFLVIFVVVIVYFYRRYKLQKQKEYVNRGRAKNGSMGLIVPDGRTYRETEVHVIVEKAELLTTEL